MKNKYEQAVSKIEKLEKDLEYARKRTDVTAFYWGSLTVKKDKWFDEKDVLSDHIIMANVKEMSRKELEKFADRMRIDRNSFLLDKEQLETELYFCYRNNKIEELVNG